MASLVHGMQLSFEDILSVQEDVQVLAAFTHRLLPNAGQLPTHTVVCSKPCRVQCTKFANKKSSDSGTCRYRTDMAALSADTVSVATLTFLESHNSSKAVTTHAYKLLAYACSTSQTDTI